MEVCKTSGKGLTGYFWFLCQGNGKVTLSINEHFKDTPQEASGSLMSTSLFKVETSLLERGKMMLVPSLL